MTTGVIKWFNETKGYGFIKPDNGSNDIFVHISEVQKAGIKSLKDEQKVIFDIENNKGKSAATNLRLAD